MKWRDNKLMHLFRVNLVISKIEKYLSITTYIMLVANVFQIN